MIDFLTENIWFYLAVGLFFIVAGAVLYSASGKIARVLQFGALGLAVIALGASLVFLVPTDRKAIKKTIYDLGDAVERNDLNGVLDLIDVKADKTRAKAVFHMKLAKIERTRIGQLKIQSVNQFTSPPTARVAFNGGVSGKVIFASTYPAADFSIVVYFEDVELGKGNDGRWRVTDNCFFRYSGYDGN